MNNAHLIHSGSIPQRQVRRPDAIRILALALVACLALSPAALALDPDPYEPNNSLGTSADLGAVGSFSDTGLTLHKNDADYYVVTATQAGTLTAQIDFLHAAGNLSLLLYSADGRWLDSS